MADIHPFRGVHYNQRKVKDLAEVICPPYDVISPQLQQELYQRNEYNFVRLEHNRELPQDTTTDNKYTRSAAVLERLLTKRRLSTCTTTISTTAAGNTVGAVSSPAFACRNGRTTSSVPTKARLPSTPPTD